MLFNSLHFAAFFALVVPAYFLTPAPKRWILLLAASCYFYMAFIPAYILILFAVILIDYLAAIWIESAQGKRRKVLLGLSVVTNLGILGFFKYYDFFATNLSQLCLWAGWVVHSKTLRWVLPIGLSFHTFQSLSYTIEVYRGRFRAERHLGIYAVYVLFFPQMVAGPIERPQNILPQLHGSRGFDYSRAVSGLRLMLLGCMKKILIADNLAFVVDRTYDHPTQFSGLAFFLATYLFAIQIYCDFSGYSDIARGCGRILGIELMENFSQPYLSTSVSEFWRRWHISLSTWFRDYLYIPLGGNRVSVSRNAINILIVFLLSGLWHGANWTFVIWGGLHGAYLLGESLLRRTGFLMDATSAGSKLVRAVVTFNLVSFAWIFFRANSLQDAFYVISHLFTGWQSDLERVTRSSGASLPVIGMEVALALAAALGLVALLQSKLGEVASRFHFLPRPARWAIYYGVVLSITFFGKYEARQFIYFQF